MTQSIRSYGGEVAYPKTIAVPQSLDELETYLQAAVANGRNVTFRGAGHAFDTQSLGSDLVVSIEKLAHVEVDVAARVVIAEGGATWRKILDQTLAAGFVPPIMVTSSQTTIAGTMSSDSLSRFTPIWGKEFRHVEWFDLLTLDGKMVRCTRTQNARLFLSAIGGLGYLGCIVKACIALVPLEGRTCLESVCVPFRGHRTMVRRLYDRARRGTEAGNATAVMPGQSTLYAVVYANGSEVRGMTVRSRYKHKQHGSRFAVHQPFTWYRPLVEIAMRATLVNRLVWRMGFWCLYTRRRTHVDPIPDFTFCMEGNRRGKVWGRRLGWPMRAHQQTFMIPATTDRDSSVHRCTAFLEAVTDDLRAHNIAPQLFDVLFIPRGNDSVLSSTRVISSRERRSYLGSFAVTLFFDTSRKRSLCQIRLLCRGWSKACVAAGGKVHLTKNLALDDEDLRISFHKQLLSFLRIKRKMDPRKTLRNGFFERLARCARA